MLYRTPFHYLTACLCVLVVLAGCSPAAQEQSATNIIPISKKSTSAFDGKKAYDLLVQQVDIGPRVPGTEGHAKCAALIETNLKKYADAVKTDSFSYTVKNTVIGFKNIVAHFNPNADKWVLLAAHWDTRPTADQEISPEKINKPIPGANDGASGTAVLLEMARMFASQKPDVGVIMVFFDGEDYGPDAQNMFIGSRRFAARLPDSAAVNGKNINISYGILLDMIGDKNLNIYQERISASAAPDVVKKVWAKAKELGYDNKFLPEVKYSINDDHIPLIQAGVKCIDVIDFDYGPWHTLDDTPDKCSPESLQIVGDVISAVVYGEKNN